VDPVRFPVQVLNNRLLMCQGIAWEFQQDDFTSLFSGRTPS
jgi:hypothetical protein